MTLIRATQSFAGVNFSFAAGQVADIPNAVAQSWIEHGLAELAEDAAPSVSLSDADLNIAPAPAPDADKDTAPVQMGDLPSPNPETESETIIVPDPDQTGDRPSLPKPKK